MKVKIFQDEEDFTLQVQTNRQRDHIYTHRENSDIAGIYYNQNKLSKTLMVSACVF